MSNAVKSINTPGTITAGQNGLMTGLYCQPGANSNAFYRGLIAGNTGLSTNNQGTGNRFY